MKKLKCYIALLIMLSVVLWTGSAHGETCSHTECEEISRLTRCEAVTYGHYTVDSILSKCKDCGAKVTEIVHGDLQGHVIHMAESLHFTDAVLHTWIFVCQDCQHLLTRQQVCYGGQDCLVYQPQAGEIPEVKYLDNFFAWRADYSEEEVIQRWLERQKAE